jgi:putative endonuclease
MFVYILYSASANKYYIGVSENAECRLLKHNSKHKGFTSFVNDWVIKYLEHYTDKTDALKREREIKNWKSRKMIEALISKG